MPFLSPDTEGSLGVSVTTFSNTYSLNKCLKMPDNFFCKSVLEVVFWNSK